MIQDTPRAINQGSMQTDEIMRSHQFIEAFKIFHDLKLIKSNSEDSKIKLASDLLCFTNNDKDLAKNILESVKKNNDESNKKYIGNILSSILSAGFAVNYLLNSKLNQTSHNECEVPKTSTIAMIGIALASSLGIFYKFCEHNIRFKLTKTYQKITDASRNRLETSGFTR